MLNQNKINVKTSLKNDADKKLTNRKNISTMKKILTLLALSCGFFSTAQQDPQYNMYQFNQMVINPAYAGARDGLAGIMTVRQQWVGIQGAPQTLCASLHTPVMAKNLGVGLTLINDRMGPRNVTSAYGNFSYILKMNRKVKLSFGVNAGYNRYQFDFGDINFKDVEAPTQLLDKQNLGALDINSGVFLKSSSFFVGLSVTHINSPNVFSYQAVNGKYVYKVRTHAFLSLGKSYIINRDFVFAPTVLIKLVNDNYSGDVNFNFFLYKKMWVGAFYRMGYGPGGLIQYYVNNQLRVAYSFDSGLGTASRLGGSHEVVIGYDFFKGGSKNRMVNPRFL